MTLDGANLASHDGECDNSDYNIDDANVDSKCSPKEEMVDVGEVEGELGEVIHDMLAIGNNPKGRGWC